MLETSVKHAPNYAMQSILGCEKSRELDHRVELEMRFQGKGTKQELLRMVTADYEMV